MRHKLLGRLHLYRFGLKFRWAYLAGLIGGVYGLAALLDSPPGGPAILALAIAFVLAGLLALARDVRRLHQQARGLYMVRTGSEALTQLKLTDLYDGFIFEDFRGLRAAWSPDLNHLLPSASLPLSIKPGRYHVPPAIKDMRPFILQQAFHRGAIIFNQPKVRLASDLTPREVGAGRALSVERTDYFSGLCTNELAPYEVRRSGRPSWRLSGLSLMASNEQMVDLTQSESSNHIGVATLALTSDGKLITTAQAGSAAQSPSLLAPSGSGSADWDDLAREKPTLQGILVRAMERELREECGIRRGSANDMRTIVLGYARFMMRGGKPEFFGFTYLPVNSGELSIPNKRMTHISDLFKTQVDVSTVSTFSDSLHAFRKEHDASVSLSLHLNLLFLENWCNAHADDFRAFVSTR